MMVPMTEELFDEIDKDEESPGVLEFVFLTEYVEEQILKLIGLEQLAYVESEFFGGEGGHMGLIWKNGQREFTGAFKKRL